ncbi:hypothetical protein QG37_07863 [Candidozyma auris]|nr:hypothetical protein QG37_07863 [[Candida] auris]
MAQGEHGASERARGPGACLGAQEPARLFPHKALKGALVWHSVAFRKALACFGDIVPFLR